MVAGFGYRSPLSGVDIGSVWAVATGGNFRRRTDRRNSSKQLIKRRVRQRRCDHARQACRR
jgi:hypothetical protein